MISLALISQLGPSRTRTRRTRGGSKTCVYNRAKKPSIYRLEEEEGAATKERKTLLGWARAKWRGEIRSWVQRKELYVCVGNNMHLIGLIFLRKQLDSAVYFYQF